MEADQQRCLHLFTEVVTQLRALVQFEGRLSSAPGQVVLLQLLQAGRSGSGQRQLLAQIIPDHGGLELISNPGRPSLLQTVLANIDTHVYMKDRCGRYVFVNHASHLHSDQPQGASLIGKTDHDVLPAAWADPIVAFDRRVFEQGGPLCQEERIPFPDGSERVYLSRKLLYPSQGEAEFLIGCSTDITALKQATAQLAASEEQFRLLAENSGDVVFLLNNDGSVRWVSPSLQVVLGWHPQDWIGEPGTRFLVHQGQSAEYQNNLSLLIEHGNPILARDQIYASDGSVHWIETHCSPFITSSGQLDGFVGHFRLIDDLVSTMASLRQSEERYRLIADNARDVIWTTEADGRCSYVSPSVFALRGFTPEEVMQEPWEQALTPESLAIARSYIQQLQAGIEAGSQLGSLRTEVEFHCKDGTTVWAEVIALPLLDDQGRFLRLLGTCREISERKRYEQDLELANEHLQALASIDAMTEVWNRRHLETLLRQAISRSDRHGETLTIILCDLDGFKAVNDLYGHLIGDLVLIEFCRRIRGILRRGDCLGRWGGEEFLLLLPHSDQQAGVALAEKLRAATEAMPFELAGRITASFGVAQRWCAEPLLSWLQRVDDALYAAKRAGRNTVQAAPGPAQSG